jgi:hypothetical protein
MYPLSQSCQENIQKILRNNSNDILPQKDAEFTKLLKMGRPFSAGQLFFLRYLRSASIREILP